jgi:hypothetical protein
VKNCVFLTAFFVSGARLVQQKNWHVPQESSGNAAALTLARRQFHAAIAHDGSQCHPAEFR